MVEFKGVTKVYNGEFVALRNINLKINDGEFVFVVGASGAGKSTFLKLIMREEVPTRGDIIINGFDLNRIKKRHIPYFRRTLGIVFQDFRLIPNMNVYDNVAFALRVTGAKEREIRQRVTHSLGMVGLMQKAKSMPHELSGGEQQRVAIARALVNNAEIIIADEPTGNVDPQMSIEITQLLDNINYEKHATVIMVTHAHDLVRKFDHRIVALNNGRIAADGFDKNVILPTVDETAHETVGYFEQPGTAGDVDDFIFNYGREETANRSFVIPADGKVASAKTAGAAVPAPGPRVPGPNPVPAERSQSAAGPRFRTESPAGRLRRQQAAERAESAEHRAETPSPAPQNPTLNAQNSKPKTDLPPDTGSFTFNYGGVNKDSSGPNGGDSDG
ncbi:MAG: cell division ATP-binding protein FtsE [Clostridia bacterium]|nr:cell division ATP-binding protein FtsE [Clostridia bacterium]